MTSRSEARTGFDDISRIRLLEGDMDSNDAVIKEINSRLGRNNQLLVGILISVTTASILMLINVLALGGR